MTAQTVEVKPLMTTQKTGIDRTTRIGIIAIVAAVVILVALISVITLLPAKTINDSISGQATELLKSQAGTLARQMESYFNNLANDLLGLANRPIVQSTTKASRTEALALLKEAGESRPGDVKSIVRIDTDGKPVYAWPDSYQQKIAAGQPLPWTVDKAWVDNIIRGRGGVAFARRSTGSDISYLLVAPVSIGTNVNEVLIYELNLNSYFDANFKPLKIGETGQIWVIDQFGLEIFQLHDKPALGEGTAQFLNAIDTKYIPGYPTDDREAIVSPVYTAFTQNRSNGGSLIIILSRATAEGQQVVTSTLQSLFVFGLLGVGAIVVLGLIIGRNLLRETNRRHTEEQRRSTTRTLLEVSRAINSSLEISVVLQRILTELQNILPHDSASILLLNEDGHTVTFAAETGLPTTDHQRDQIELKEVRGAREVIKTGKPTLINDCANDPRWNPVPGSSIRSWLGVPLRVRDQSVGVLNVNSHQPNRFQSDDVDLGEAFADQAGAAIQNARAHELQIQVYEAELETAQAIQNSLLPQEAPPMPQLDVAARSVPARHVSGDYYQYFMLPDGKLGFAVGDVSGKGIPAALLMAVITTALRDEILRIPSPAELLNELNKRLLPRMQQNKMNSALLVCVFDPITRHVEMANGGMVQPYVRTTQGWEFVPVGGYPLGAASRTSYSAKTVTLAPESMLLFITDGIVEAQNQQNELYGFDRLEALLNSLPLSVTANQVADTILAAVREFLQGQEAQDDITIVVVKSLEIERVKA